MTRSTNGAPPSPERLSGRVRRSTLRSLAALALLGLTVLSGSAHAADGLVGRVVRADGRPLEGAVVALLGPDGQLTQQAVTGPDGAFRLALPAAGAPSLRASMPGFHPLLRRIDLARDPGHSVTLTLQPLQFEAHVAVHANRADRVSAFEAAAAISVVPASDMPSATGSLLPVALREVPALHLQQTSASQGSPFLRGLTGQQVTTLIDGVRYNNATFRPGANQYLALIDPSLLAQVEIVQGPDSSQYGSDALGGTIGLVLRTPAAGPASAEITLLGATADQSLGLAGQVEASRERFSFLGGGRLRDVGDLRAGSGRDSHSVATRLLGLPSTVLGERLADTAYRQVDANLRIDRHGEADAWSFVWLRGDQRGASRYDQLDGGVGNLLNRFDPQILDFAMLRHVRQRLAGLDNFSATVSYNAQTDDREFQNVNNSQLGLRSPITQEGNQDRALGLQTQAAKTAGRHHLGFGAEAYVERIHSTRRELSYSLATQDFTSAATVRARFPDESGYQTMGLFASDRFEIPAAHLTATLGGRLSRFSYEQKSASNPSDAAGRPLVLDYDTALGDLTWDAGLVWAPRESLRLVARAGRGFRAPNANDYGAIGLSGLGFEVSAEEGERLNGEGGALNGARLPISEPIRPLEPERLTNWELGLRVRRGSFEAALNVHASTLAALIERRSLLLPPGAVGQLVGGQPIVRQDPSGAVYTSLSSRPVFVRANGADVRFRGANLAVSARLGSDWSVHGSGFWIRAEEASTGNPPSLENGVPPPAANLRLRWAPPRSRAWAEATLWLAATQDRLSANDMLQPRIGGTRTRTEIADFFNNGAVARGLVAGGLLIPTGETLSQVQNRVLGSATSAPLYTSHAGYSVVGARGGLRLGPHSVTLVAENLLDGNYRTMGSGVDGPGFNVQAYCTLRFGGPARR
jgi:hemoglobin/transferrin/lactoferrin receptor protein